MLWLEQTQFRAVRVELIQKEMRHNGKAGLAGWFRTTWLPYIERIPESQKEEFVDDVVSHYLAKHPPDVDGSTCVKMVRLEVEAVWRF